jgi:hypothetical protein
MTTALESMMSMQDVVKPQWGTEVVGSPNNEKISALVDIVDGGYTPFDLHYAPFCSGQSHLPNGDIVVCGGGGVTYKFPGFMKGYNVGAGCRHPVCKQCNSRQSPPLHITVDDCVICCW